MKFSTRNLFLRSDNADNLKRAVFSSQLIALSAKDRLRRQCLETALWLEGGGFYSVTAREIMLIRYGIEIGAYSYGECFEPGAFAKGTIIGRYVSIGPRVRAYTANHPLDRISTHPFFFNKDLGFVRETNVPFTQLIIEHDAWIGESVIITPGCKRVGLGAALAAGSVVTKDVPDFAVVGGVPARVLKFRFPEDLQERLRQSAWWNLSIANLALQLESFLCPVTTESLHHHFFTSRQAFSPRHN